MNQWIKRFCAAALLCSLAACSSAAPAENSTDTNTNTETSSQTTAADTASTAAEAGAALQAALKEQGYTITQVENEADECDFHATSDTGSVEVNISKYAGAAAARAEYEEETSVFNDEDFYVQDTYTCSKGEYSTLRNSINYIWAIEALDTENSLVYDIEEIPEASLESIQSALESIGFTK